MKLLDLIGTIIAHVPFLGQFLPKDKPWYQSATAQAGTIWGVLEAVIPLVEVAYPPTIPFCTSVLAVLRTAGPILMILGVRKTVIDNANGNPNIVAPVKK